MTIMEGVVGQLASVAAALTGVAGFAAAVSRYFAQRTKVARRQAAADREAALSQAIQQVIETNPDLDHTDWKTLLADLHLLPLEPDEVREEPTTQHREAVTHQVEDLESRIAKIEGRFPEETTIDKVASINDALLGKGLEELSRRVEFLERRTLTKWDVVTVVFAILAALGVVLGIVVGLITIAGKIHAPAVPTPTVSSTPTR